jgi:hypothetical protein
MFDISSVKVPSTGRNKYWLLVMDEYSGYLWRYFFRYRDDLTVTMTAFVKRFPRTFDNHTPLNKMVEQNLSSYPKRRHAS